MRAMKTTTLFTAAFATIAFADLIPREEEIITVTVCKFGLLELSEQVCDFYIQNGVLTFIDGGTTPDGTEENGSKPSPLSKAEGAAPPIIALQPVSTTISLLTLPSPLPSPPELQSGGGASVSPTAANKVASSSAGGVNADSAMANINVPFVDGTVACQTVPVQFGADASLTQYLGGNGWLNSQIGYMQGNAIAGLRNAVGCNPLNQANGQVMFCNYNCPGTFLPSQRPTAQGINGESVGGLECKAGFLYKTNPDSSILCQPGSTSVTVEVVNNLDKEVVICKTNYPGDEAMTIPFPISPGHSTTLPLIDSSTFYRTAGTNLATTGQFYLNEPGVPISEACVWGTAGSRRGNFVTMNIGAGIQPSQPAYVSLFTNFPTDNAGTYPAHVRVVGNGVEPAAGCAYDGIAGLLSFNGRDQSTVAQAASVGCTVAVGQGGTVQFVIS